MKKRTLTKQEISAAAKAMGRLGGLAKSAAKVAASRANGKKHVGKGKA